MLSDPSIERLRSSEITEIDITDTIPLPPAKQLERIKVLSVAPLIGEAIRRIHRGESVGALFADDLQLVQEMLLWDEQEDGDADGDGNRPKAAMTHARHDERELSAHR